MKRKDKKLLAIGLLFFVVVLPLAGRTTTQPYPTHPRPVFGSWQSPLLIQDKIVVKPKKLQACTDKVICIFWGVCMQVTYHCSGEGYGGGGGGAF
jgi:hypothetical protein